MAEKPVAEIRRLLLSPAAHAPSGFVLSGKVVCQCFNVTEDAIISALGDIAGEPRARCGAAGAAQLWVELRVLHAGIAAAGRADS